MIRLNNGSTTISSGHFLLSLVNPSHQHPPDENSEKHVDLRKVCCRPNSNSTRQKNVVFGVVYGLLPKNWLQAIRVAITARKMNVNATVTLAKGGNTDQRSKEKSGKTKSEGKIARNVNRHVIDDPDRTEGLREAETPNPNPYSERTIKEPPVPHTEE